jgi:Asp-tRNA(Asn)/Glu-tRNA(Gln) amidotransferase A subunit family amidase
MMPLKDEDRELAFTPVHKLVQMIKKKKLSPVELMGAVFRRIEELNPKLNAFLTLAEEEAMNSAKKAEEALSRGVDVGPLHGMPVAIKDLYNTRGMRTTSGSLVNRDYIPEEDGLLARRMKEAGGIVIGKTNVPEYGCANSTENKLGDACRNPWNSERSSGGSSGGAAAAVAAALCPISPGSDGGGSIRIPAGLCGIYGFKPTYGRIPYDVDPVYGPAIDFICHGPMTRNVRDAAFLLNVMSGSEKEDYNSIKKSPPDFQKQLERSPQPLKIAWSPDLGYEEVDLNPEVKSITEASVKSFEELGHHIEESTPPLGKPFHAWEIIASAENDLIFGAYLDEHPRMLMPYFRLSLEIGRELSGAEVIKAWIEVGKWRAGMRDFFQIYDLLITPTTAVPAFPIGTKSKKIGLGMVQWGLTPFTPLFNFTHHPAATIPCGFTSEGLPVGLQIVGRLEDESTLLKISYAFEKMRPWADERPPLS